MISVVLISRGPWINWVKQKIEPCNHKKNLLFISRSCCVHHNCCWLFSRKCWIPSEEGAAPLGPCWCQHPGLLGDNDNVHLNLSQHTFLFHSIWRTMSEFSETSGSPETSRQKKGAKFAVNTWCTTTCSLRRYNSWEGDKELGASSRIPMHAQDPEA